MEKRFRHWKMYGALFRLPDELGSALQRRKKAGKTGVFYINNKDIRYLQKLGKNGIDEVDGVINCIKKYGELKIIRIISYELAYFERVLECRVHNLFGTHLANLLYWGHRIECLWDLVLYSDVAIMGMYGIGVKFWDDIHRVVHGFNLTFNMDLYKEDWRYEYCARTNGLKHPPIYDEREVPGGWL